MICEEVPPQVPLLDKEASEPELASRCIKPT